MLKAYHRKDEDVQETMKLAEAAAFLGKSIAQTRRYMDSGLLPAHKVGKELFFDRDTVIEFARSRGIRTAEREVPQGSNFTDPRQAQEYLKRFLVPGATLTLAP